VVHTIPEVEKSNITLEAGKHNIIALNAPQGYLHLVMDGDNEYKNLCAIIRKNDDAQTLNVQGVESTEKYITGKYDLEILTLPRMYASGVKISQSATTTITIPQAGTVTFNMPSAGPSSVYEDDKGKMIWVCNLDPKLATHKLIMQPGLYHVVFRSQDVKQTVFTIDKSFQVKSGDFTVVELEQ
jgi:Ca-activated chloride channel family protein